jgi:hypothetical protein
MRRPGSSTEASKPEELELDTEPALIDDDIVDWAKRLFAGEMVLVGAGSYTRPAPDIFLTAANLHYENWYLRHENAALQGRLEILETRISKLEAVTPEVKVVVLREITREQAKSEIRELFASGEALDFEEIVDRLQLDLELVVAICDELMKEGEIGPDAGVHGCR